MKIAVLGWGSLIWDSRNLAIQSQWQLDGPKLPVEFGRVSMGDRLTLILEEGAKILQVLWALSSTATMELAKENLREREGTASRYIHFIAVDSNSEPPALGVAKTVWDWALVKGLDGAVWTGLGSKRPEGHQGEWDYEARLNYLRDLKENGRSGAAEEYIRGAPSQIRTTLRSMIEQELGWKPLAGPNCTKVSGD
ncbi:hypothetical protein [Elongatibacter sediminis]|uniref:Uncharacterized protein n=1 Tax=Elongatibacter sediminis TaxID=3119006 RepID=A0AAW9RKM4_9GAMM